MKVGIDFEDIKTYIEQMNKGIEDKLFFLDKIKFNDEESYLFVDFGCADGTLISVLFEIFKERGIHAYYIGYDISEEMINLAKTKFRFTTDSVLFTSDWREVDEVVKRYSAMNSVLILSSVIHEVYSYANEESDIELFWHRVLDTGFKYICVRDMMCSADANRATSPENHEKLNNAISFASEMSRLRREFENVWGPLGNNLNLVHFLLKYRWKINWQREVHENYFPIMVDDFLHMFEGEYNLLAFERFRVPFHDECIKKDFGIELEDYTHIKAVFEKNKQ